MTKKTGSNKKSAPKKSAHVKPSRAKVLQKKISAKSSPPKKFSVKKKTQTPVSKKSSAKKSKNTAAKKAAPKKIAMSKNLKKSKPAPKKAEVKKTAKAAPKKPQKKSAPKQMATKQMTTKKSAKKVLPSSTKKVASKKIPSKQAAAKVVKKAVKASASKSPAKLPPKKSIPAKVKASASKVKAKPEVSQKQKLSAKVEKQISGAKSKISSPKKNETAKKSASKKSSPKKDEVKFSNSNVGKLALETPVKPPQKPSVSIYFSLEDLDSFLERKQSSKTEEDFEKKSTQKEKNVKIKSGVSKVPAKPLASSKTVGVASIEDILGFNLFEEPSREKVEEKDIPRKWKKYYNMLISMRKHFSSGAEARAEEVLKRSAKEDSGDLSSYGQHLADAGSESFERDMAYCLLSTEKEMIDEIDAAIERMKEGTYGVCELTGKSIPEARLKAVPFTRYTIEGQRIKDKENSRKRDDRGQFSPFGEIVAGDGTVEDAE